MSTSIEWTDETWNPVDDPVTNTHWTCAAAGFDSTSTSRRAMLLQAAGIPMGGCAATSTTADTRYPLVCVCAEPDPEWVYVAHQCRRCWRVMRTAEDA